MSYRWHEADEVSDRIVELIQERVEMGIMPMQVLVGLLLGTMAFLKTAPID